MSENVSLLNDLTKPATVLIEKIADATGVFYEPRRIINRAKAEAEAKIIHAKADIEVNDLQRRALNRFVQEETKKQQNIEEIMDKTIPLLDENSKPEEIEEDWIANFFDKCRIVSDEEMQNLWAKILAGEANEPNSFSKRTVNLLATFDKTDANLFTHFCWFIKAESRFIMNQGKLWMAQPGDLFLGGDNITFEKIVHLESIGLIKFTEIDSSEERQLLSPINSKKVVRVFEFPSILTGKIFFTQTGKELSRLCGIRW